MADLKHVLWRAERLRHAAFARGHIDAPSMPAHVGRHGFQGWVACAQPIERITLELDGLLYERVAVHERADVPPLFGLPYITGWKIVIDVPPSRRRGLRMARLLVNGRTAIVAALAFEPALPQTFAAAPDESSRRPEQRFYAVAAALPVGSRVLEVGTRQVVEGTSTHGWRAFPGVARADYVMCDLMPGRDVDVIGDLHGLPASWSASFDAFVAHAVFEHLERPWVAAKEVARILKPGGVSLVATHQCFPLHGYPMDFFRFSKEALSLIFEDAGLQVLEAAYQSRATITAPADVVAPSFHDQWNATWPSYIKVAVLAIKPA